VVVDVAADSIHFVDRAHGDLQRDVDLGPGPRECQAPGDTALLMVTHTVADPGFTHPPV
jgi:hypothetical protein